MDTTLTVVVALLVGLVTATIIAGILSGNVSGLEDFATNNINISLGATL